MHRSHRGYRWSFIFVASIILVCCTVLAQQVRRLDQNALRNAAQSGEWLTYGGDYAERRYSPLDQINASNVNRLGLAWTAEVGRGGGNQEATPLFWNGVVYSITNWSIAFAVDARTGKELWRYDPEVDRAFCNAGRESRDLLWSHQSRTRTLRRKGHRSGY
jgi:quinohemoprotein ethanol dehydrogenase